MITYSLINLPSSNLVAASQEQPNREESLGVTLPGQHTSFIFIRTSARPNSIHHFGSQHTSLQYPFTTATQRSSGVHVASSIPNFFHIFPSSTTTTTAKPRHPRHLPPTSSNYTIPIQQQQQHLVVSHFLPIHRVFGTVL